MGPIGPWCRLPLAETREWWVLFPNPESALILQADIPIPGIKKAPEVSLRSQTFTRSREVSFGVGEAPLLILSSTELP